MEQAVQTFLAQLTAQMHPLVRALNLANWHLATTGDRRYAAETEQLRGTLMTLLSQPQDWQRVSEWYEQRDALQNTTLRRQLEVAYYQYARNQLSPEYITQIAHLEAELGALYPTFRATLAGQSVSDNAIKQILEVERDVPQRQDAWEASKQIGPVAAPLLRELVTLRNNAAQTLGWKDYYSMALDLQEIDEDALFALLDDLEQQTRQPFQQLKGQIDTALAEQFGVAVEDLRPWHYSDPFFQKPPTMGGTELDALYAQQDMMALTLRTFDGLGLEVRDVLARSDLDERVNKHQHAFCTHVDPASDDVRILANLRPTAESMDTCLHEFGHAIYNRYLSADLPFLLRRAAHANTTEAVAMIMGRLARNTAWLTTIRGLAPAEAEHWAAPAREAERIKQLVFVRWGLVMVHFERDLYRVGGDLNRRWWEYVERFQQVSRPDQRDAPDWASKVHFAIAPVYYHNYILGELTASQLCQAIGVHASNGQRDGVAVLVNNPAAGQFLQERLFALGSSLPWNETLKHVTGDYLDSRHFVADFVRPAG